MATEKKASIPDKKATKKDAAKAARARSPKGLNLRSASPSFTVNDVEKSMAWYRDVLGFRVANRWEDGGKLRGVEMEAGDVLIMLGQDDWHKGRDRVKGEGTRIYYDTTKNIDRIAERIKANGGTLTSEPKDQPWGTRDLSLEDPDGFKITIGADLKKKRGEKKP